MIHCMADCLTKLRALKRLANEGVQESSDVVQKMKFEQISMEVSYLIIEAEADANSGDSFLRNYAKDYD